MNVVERVGRDEPCGRKLFILECSTVAEVPALEVGGRFVCLVAWDAAGVPEAEVAGLAERLLAAGCVYICTWGSGCERVHDIFDHVDVTRSPEGPWVMSTWHDEPFDEALWFLLFAAYPDPSFADTCCSAVVVSIGMAGCAAATRTAMQDPSSFSARITEEP
jgi:hypothetical protein